MPKWEIRIQRKREQTFGRKKRTVGTYQVYHDGQPATGTIRVGDRDALLFGTTAEAPGPSQNVNRAEEGFPTRILAKTYPMKTSGGPTYVTHGYRQDEAKVAKMPGLELTDTGRRTDILIHPGKDEFRSTVGCINLCTHLDTPQEIISYKGSRRRVIALIEDMKAFLGPHPGPDQPIPNAFVVIDDTELAGAEAAPAKPATSVPAVPSALPAGIGWPLKHNVIRMNLKNHTFGKVRNSNTTLHQGWDLEAVPGTPCFAIADGKIALVYVSDTYGHVVVLGFPFEGSTHYAAYAHLSAVAVEQGQSVAKGEKVGLTGNTGNARSMKGRDQHLHLEIRTVPRPDAGTGLKFRRDPAEIFGATPLRAPIGA